MPEWLSVSTILTALAGVLAIAAAIVSSIEATKGAKENNDLLLKLDEKNKQVIALQQKSLDYFTGGDSVLYLHFFDDKFNQPVSLFKIEGTSPIPSASIKINQLEKILELKAAGKEANEIEDSKLTIEIDRHIYPGTTLGIPRFPFPESGNGVFILQVFVPMARYIQIVRMQKIDDKTHAYAYQVYRATNNDLEITEVEVLPKLFYCDPTLVGQTEWLKPVTDIGSVLPDIQVRNPQQDK